MEKTIEFSEAIKAFILEKQEKKQKEVLDPPQLFATWLDGAARRAKQIQVVTHPMKYTHSDAKGSSVQDQGVRTFPPGLCCQSIITASTVNVSLTDIDGNAAAFDIAAFVQLRIGNTTLLDYIKKDDISPFRPFAESDSQASEWVIGFSQMLKGKEPASHTLAKQIYFPLSSGHYHLLSPLFASTLSYAIGERVRMTHFSKEAQEAREARKDGEPSLLVDVQFRNLAIKKFGGSKPQNISYLNSKQRGEAFLLSCAPPIWNKQSRPPLNEQSFFSKTSKHINTLKEFLEKVKDADSKKSIRDVREDLVDLVIDQLVMYAAEIQQLEESGWSAKPECKLPFEQRLWLDPLRAQQDEVFAAQRELGDWREIVADQFAGWFNDQLSQPGLKFGDTERREWRHIISNRIKHFREFLEDLI